MAYIASICYYTICLTVLNSSSQNRDLKCNRICKLPASSSCLDTFLWSLFFPFKLSIFILSSFFSFYIQLWTHCNDLGLCVGGGTAAVHRLHTGDVSSSAWVWVPLIEEIFLFNNFSNAHYIVKVTNTGLRDIKQLMGYRNAQWYNKDTWIGFSARKIAKQAVVHHIFKASRTMGCLKWWNYCL